MIVTLVVAGVAGVAGATFGAWSTCGSDCGFDVSKFEAIGVWIGAVGTTSAVAWAAATYRIEAQRHAAEADARAAERERLNAEMLALAERCVLRLTPKITENSAKVRIEFRNSVGAPVTDLVALMDDEILGQASLVSGTTPWGFNVEPEQVGLREWVGLSEQRAREELNIRVKPQLTFEFTIGIDRFRRVGNDVARITSPSQHASRVGMT